MVWFSVVKIWKQITCVVPSNRLVDKEMLIRYTMKYYSDMRKYETLHSLQLGWNGRLSYKYSDSGKSHSYVYNKQIQQGNGQSHE